MKIKRKHRRFAKKAGRSVRREIKRLALKHSVSLEFACYSAAVVAIGGMHRFGDDDELFEKLIDLIDDARFGTLPNGEKATEKAY